MISSVIAASAFLFISGLFKSYFVADPSDIARSSEDFYFHNVRQQIKNAISGDIACSEKERNVREFKAFAQKEIQRLGYLLFLNYTYNCTRSELNTSILLASERMILCERQDVNAVLPNRIELSCIR